MVRSLSVPAPDLFCSDLFFCLFDLRMDWASGPEALSTPPLFTSLLYLHPLSAYDFNCFLAYL
jgi:hypothetical protein